MTTMTSFRGGFVKSFRRSKHDNVDLCLCFRCKLFSVGFVKIKSFRKYISHLPSHSCSTNFNSRQGGIYLLCGCSASPSRQLRRSIWYAYLPHCPCRIKLWSCGGVGGFKSIGSWSLWSTKVYTSIYYVGTSIYYFVCIWVNNSYQIYMRICVEMVGCHL